MKAEYLIIGNGLDGEVIVEDSPQRILSLSGTPPKLTGSHRGQTAKTFEVDHIRHNRQFYAVAVGRATCAQEIVTLIENSGIRPIPEEVLDVFHA